MNKMMQQAQQMQEQMQQAQEEAANEIVEASAGGGMVTVKATGGGEIVGIEIDPKAIDPDDPELLADMVLAAVNEALRSANALMESKVAGPAARRTQRPRPARALAARTISTGRIARPPLTKQRRPHRRRKKRALHSSYATPSARGVPESGDVTRERAALLGHRAARSTVRHARL